MKRSKLIKEIICKLPISDFIRYKYQEINLDTFKKNLAIQFLDIIDESELDYPYEWDKEENDKQTK